VPDLDDIYLPRPTDLLVNLTEAKASVENLLGRFPELFADNTTIGSALGPALQAAFKMIVSGFLVCCAQCLMLHAVGYRRQGLCLDSEHS
jgi:protein transport protein SEC24